MQAKPSELTPMNEVLKHYWASVDSKPAGTPAPEAEAVCQSCNDTGFFTYNNVPVDHPLFGKPQRCDNPDCKAAQEATKRALINFALPDEYRRLTFERWDTEVKHEDQYGKQIAYQAARMFTAEPNHWVSLIEAGRRAGYVFEAPDKVCNSLAFFGVPGMGKTGLVAAMMNDLSRQKIDVLYRRTSDLLIDLQGAFDNRDKAAEANEFGFAQRIQRYQQAGILVLDEWRMENMTPARRQWMEDVVRYRHGHRLPTLFTTNENPSSIYHHWTEQTADVALEMALWIEMKGTKLRQTRNWISDY